MKLLGIDYGSKNIGVAMSDEDGVMAFPKEIIANDKNALPYILKIIESEKIGAVILGESMDYKGEENPIMEDIRRFKKNLTSRTSVPIHFEAEILSTQEARHGQEDVKKVDSGAATIILQSYIDRIKN